MNCPQIFWKTCKPTLKRWNPRSAISDQSSGVGNHVAASAALDDAFSRGNEAVRRADAIVRNKYANNPGLLAEWTAASHVERAPKRAKPDASQPTTSPPPST